MDRPGADFSALITSGLDELVSSAVLCDLGGRLLYVNRAFLDRTGIMGPKEVLGREFAEFTIDAGEARQRLAQVVREGFWTGLLKSRLLGEQVREVLCTASLAHDASGQPAGILAICRDITEYRQALDQKLADERRQRDALVREVHHRIKNTLQGVVGLLRQQLAPHAELRVVLDRAASQVNAVALVHGLQSRVQRQGLLLCEIAAAVAGAVHHVYAQDRDMSYRRDLNQAIEMKMNEAVPVAIILNELVTNAFKHSVRDRRDPVEVLVEIQRGSATVRVTNASADGALLPTTGETGEDGEGLNLVRALLPDRGAELNYRHEHGRMVCELRLYPPIVGEIVSAPAAFICQEGQ